MMPIYSGLRGSLPVHTAEHPGLRKMRRVGLAQSQALLVQLESQHIQNHNMRDVIPGAFIPTQDSTPQHAL